MILLQIATDTAAAVTQPANGDISILSLTMKGGWLEIPMILMGFIAVYLFIERYLTIKKASRIDPGFMNQIRELVLNGNIEAARTLCKNTPTPIARMVHKGLSRIGKPFSDIKGAIENEGNLEVFKLEKNLAFLATIAGAAPMIGFLGTVTGMISAFYKIAQPGAAAGPELVAGGIYEALVTTATGLFIGIPAYLMYNQLTIMIDKLVFKMEDTTVEFIDLLEEPA